VSCSPRKDPLGNEQESLPHRHEDFQPADIAREIVTRVRQTTSNDVVTRLQVVELC
jgi:hypothetical protein